MSINTPSPLIDLLWLLGAYMVGSIPFGLLLARRFLKLDLRELGSGNIGATNAVRAGGKGFGAAVLLLDALKGALPALVLLSLGHPPNSVLPVAVGLMAVLGHCSSPWLGFSGGKGVATTLGMVLALAPTLALAGLAVYVLIFFCFRVSGLGSLIAIGALTLISWWTHGLPLCGMLSLVYAVIVWRHRGNIEALLAARRE